MKTRRTLMLGGAALSVAAGFESAPARAAEDGRLVEVRGTRLYVEDVGPRAAPALVYLHGGPGSGSYDFALHQKDRLSRRLRLVLFDQRGVLRSDAIAPEAAFGLRDLVEDTEALRQALGIERWSVLGHSSGGLIAAMYAAAYPNAVDRVVFENPTFDFIGSSRNQAEAAAGIFRAAGEADAALAAEAVVAAPRAEVWPLFRRTFSALGPRRSQLSVHGPDKGFFDRIVTESGRGTAWARASVHQQKLFAEGVIFDSFVPRLGEITQPALLIKGRYDLSTDPDQLAAFRRLVRGGRVVEFQNSSHFARFEEPDRYARVVTGFILGR